jgi:hypothetical protein
MRVRYRGRSDYPFCHRDDDGLCFMWTEPRHVTFLFHLRAMAVPAAAHKRGPIHGWFATAATQNVGGNFCAFLLFFFYDGTRHTAHHGGYRTLFCRFQTHP